METDRSVAVPANQLSSDDMATYGKIRQRILLNIANVATCAHLKQICQNVRDSLPFCQNPVCPDPAWKPVTAAKPSATTLSAGICFLLFLCCDSASLSCKFLTRLPGVAPEAQALPQRLWAVWCVIALCWDLPGSGILRWRQALLVVYFNVELNM